MGHVLYYKDLIKSQKHMHPCLQHAISKYTHSKQIMYDYVMYHHLLCTYPFSKTEDIAYKRLHKRMHKIVEIKVTHIPMYKVNQLCDRNDSAFFCNYAISNNMTNIHVYTLKIVSQNHDSHICAI